MRAESASATRSPSLLLLAGLTGGFPGPVLGVFKMQVVRVPFAASDAVRWCVRPASPRSTRCAAFSTIGTRTVLCWKPSLEKAGWWRYSYRRRKKLLLHHFQPPHWHGMCQEHICLSAFLAAPTFLQGQLRRFSIRGPPPRRLQRKVRTFISGLACQDTDACPCAAADTVVPEGAGECVLVQASPFPLGHLRRVSICGHP